MLITSESSDCFPLYLPFFSVWKAQCGICLGSQGTQYPGSFGKLHEKLTNSYSEVTEWLRENYLLRRWVASLTWLPLTGILNAHGLWYMMPCMACSDRLCIILIYVHNVVDTVRRHFSQVCCTDNIKHFIVHMACWSTSKPLPIHVHKTVSCSSLLVALLQGEVVGKVWEGYPSVSS